MKVFDHGTESDGLTYMAMELLEGEELSDVIAREAPMPAPRIVAILGQVLAALAAAHREGIVHRDLKPENIMLVTRTGDDGKPVEVVKVTDFGIAKTFGDAATAAPAITTFGTVNGTPEYMSPEQANAEELDGRSDLYACGAILFQMLTGGVPFDADSPLQILEKHLRDPIPVPSKRRRGADKRLDPIATKALAKRRDDRYADAASMRAALIAAMEQPPIPDDPAPETASGGSSVLIESGGSVLIDAGEASKPVPQGSVLIESGAPELMDAADLARGAPPKSAGSETGSVLIESGGSVLLDPESVAKGSPSEAPKSAGETPKSEARKIEPTVAKPAGDEAGPGLVVLLLVLAVAAAAGAWWLLRSQSGTTSAPSDTWSNVPDARPVNPNLPVPATSVIRNDSPRIRLPRLRPRVHFAPRDR